MEFLNRNTAHPAKFDAWLAKHPVRFPAPLAAKIRELEECERETYARQVKLGADIEAYHAKAQALEARIHSGRHEPGDIDEFASSNDHALADRKFRQAQASLQAEADALKVKSLPFLKQAFAHIETHMRAQLDEFNARLSAIYSDAGVPYNPEQQLLLWAIERYLNLAGDALCSGIHGPGIVRLYLKAGADLSDPAPRK